MYSIILIGTITILSSLISCETDIFDFTDCDRQVIIDSQKFNNAPADVLEINSLTISGDCLLIDFSSGGCDGSTWILELIYSGDIMESYPAQRKIRLSLKNEELCDAYITREVSFDVSPIQTSGGKVWLILENSGDRILYEY